ncbi:MAG: hypothetical protein WAL56_04735 [Candidatus Sulfotelmatobacter sp.]
MVAQPTDESKPTILPEVELNPLVNPLLAAHMGRWAEVYFTSPPEKRAQAVSDLVRDLAKQPIPDPSLHSPAADDEHLRQGADEEVDQNSAKSSAHAIEQIEQQDGSFGAMSWESTSRNFAISEETAYERTPFQDAPSGPIRCESCGHDNGTEQRFCVMCGTPLVISSENLRPQELVHTEPIGPNSWGKSDAHLDHAQDSEPERPAELSPEYEPEPANPAWSLSDGSPTHDDPHFSVLSDYQSEPASRSYKIYVGLAVAILLGLMVYMTWRSNSAFRSSGAAPSLPQAVPAAKPEAAAEPPATVPALPTLKTKASAEPLPLPKTKPPEEVRRKEARKTARKAQVQPTSRTIPSPANAGILPAGQNGSEELSIAEKYLNAGSGRARDSRQAVTWLWKAVAKQNPTATLLLSDLYLRGDGATKSCDQARLLLDAAARKGVTAAAERLRNLQAFGCR